jgi:hypothetical protein
MFSCDAHAISIPQREFSRAQYGKIPVRDNQLISTASLTTIISNELNVHGLKQVGIRSLLMK